MKTIALSLAITVGLSLAAVAAAPKQAARFTVHDASKTDWGVLHVMKDTVSGQCFVVAIVTGPSGSFAGMPVSVGPILPCGEEK